MTSYRVEATAETPEALGHVLARLAGIKGVSIDYHVVEDAPHTKNKSQAKPGADITNIDFVLRIMRATEGVVTTAQLREKFKSDGRNPEAAHGSIHHLMAQKKIRRTKPGTYKLLATAEKEKTR